MLLRLLELRKLVIITPTHCQRAGYATPGQPPLFLHSLDLWGHPRFTFPRSVGGHFFPESAGKNNSMFILWNMLTFSMKGERNSYIVLSFGAVCMGMAWLILTEME